MSGVVGGDRGDGPGDAMTEDVVDRLEARARAATPGPWNSPAPGRVGTPDGRRTEIGILRRVADADYVAAADPQTVLHLIVEMRRWKLYAESLRDAMHNRSGDA